MDVMIGIAIIIWGVLMLYVALFKLKDLSREDMDKSPRALMAVLIPFYEKFPLAAKVTIILLSASFIALGLYFI